MKNIIIVGGGEIGSFIAGQLTREGFNITLVEQDPALLEELQDRIDVDIVCADSLSVDALLKAGAENADVFISTARRDETNIMSCLIAHQLKIPYTIAITRFLGSKYHPLSKKITNMGVDMLINISEIAAREIANLSLTRDSGTIINLENSPTALLCYRIEANSSLISASKDFLKSLSLACVVRNNSLLSFANLTSLRAGDLLYFITKEEDVDAVCSKIGILKISSRSAVIYGDNFLAQSIASRLLGMHFRLIMLTERKFNRDILEASLKDHTRLNIVQGSGTELKVMEEHVLEDTSVFIAATANDAFNMHACLIAKSLDVEKTIAVVRRSDLIPLCASLRVDAGISPRLSVAKSIQSLVHEHRLSDYHVTEHSGIEIVEIEAYPNSLSVGKPLAKLRLPPQIIVGGVVRENNELVITYGQEDCQLEPGDKAIIFTPPEFMQLIEEHFDPKRTF